MQRPGRYGNKGGRPAAGRGGQRRRPPSPPQNKKSDAQKKTETDQELQKRPAQQWKRVKPIGENRGGLNGGVYIVKDRKGKIFIEKRAQKELVREKIVTQEITILKYLSEPSHPHITKMVDHYIDTKRCESSIYLEWCDVGGLNSLIDARLASKELFNEQDVWEWYIQLFSALTYCHYGPNPSARFQYKKPEDWKNGWDMVYHRDIKVDNILVAKGGPPGQTMAYTLKLADFGCAVARRHIWTNVDDKRLENPWVSKGWTPPEFPTFLGRSDVWQLGAVMGCICNLQTMPFFDFADPAPGYSRDLAGAIAASVEGDPAKRPKSDAVLKHVRDRYEKIRGDLERSPRPVPGRVDRRKLDGQVARGHARLKAEMDKEKREKEKKKGQSRSPPPGQNQFQQELGVWGSGYAGYPGGMGGPPGFQPPFGGMPGPGFSGPFGGMHGPGFPGPGFSSPFGSPTSSYYSSGSIQFSYNLYVGYQGGGPRMPRYGFGGRRR